MYVEKQLRRKKTDMRTRSGKKIELMTATEGVEKEVEKFDI